MKYCSKLKKYLAISVSVVTIASYAQFANAGAWLVGKGKQELTTDFLYSFPFKFSSTGSDDNGVDGAFVYNIDNKISNTMLTLDYEYGITDDYSFLGLVNMYRYDDYMSLRTSINGIQNASAKISTEYYSIVPEIGFKGNIYNNNLDTAFSYRLYFASGDMMVGKSTTSYVGRKASTKAALLYGYSFSLPFIPSKKDTLPHYVDLSAEYQFYHQGSHHQFNTEAVLAVKPWDDEWTLLTGLYSNFNAYNYSKREFARSSVANTINSFGLVSDYSNLLKEDALQSLIFDGHGPFHQISFQVAYDITPNETIYLKSFHSIFVGKPFDSNSVLLSLDYKF